MDRIIVCPQCTKEYIAKEWECIPFFCPFCDGQLRPLQVQVHANRNCVDKGVECKGSPDELVEIVRTL